MAESRRVDGAKIRAARAAKGWNQEKLAEKAGYKLSVIQKLEQGSYFSQTCLEACAEALEVQVDDLVMSSESELSGGTANIDTQPLPSVPQHNSPSRDRLNAWLCGYKLAEIECKGPPYPERFRWMPGFDTLWRTNQLPEELLSRAMTDSGQDPFALTLIGKEAEAWLALNRAEDLAYAFELGTLMIHNLKAIYHMASGRTFSGVSVSTTAMPVIGVLEKLHLSAALELFRKISKTIEDGQTRDGNVLTDQMNSFIQCVRQTL